VHIIHVHEMILNKARINGNTKQSAFEIGINRIAQIVEYPEKIS
jgi:hypothetical protein